MGSFDCAERSPGALRTRPAAPEAFKSCRRVIVVMCGPPPLVSAAEVEPSNLRVIPKHVARPLGADAAHGEHVGPLTQGEGLVRVLLDEQDAEAAGIDVANAVED